MASRAFSTWMDRLDTGRLTHSQILQAGRVISAHAIHGSIPGGKRTSLTHDEAKLLAQRLRENPIVLYPEHEEQGWDWFTRRARRELEGLDDATFEDITHWFHHFEWDGTVEIDGVWPHVSVVPVWTMVVGPVGMTQAIVDQRHVRRYQYYFASGWRNDRGNAGRLWAVEEAPAT